MLDFHCIGLEDKERLEGILTNAPNRGCEYTFGNLFIWKDTYNTQVAYTDDGLAVVRFTAEPHSYLFPVGDGDIKPVIEDMIEQSGALGGPFRIIAARREDVELLETLFPNRFSSHASRDFAEYIYNSEDLIELRGKKYHGKRNHIRRFLSENPEYSFEEITAENIGEAEAMNEAWYDQNIGYDLEGLTNERNSSNLAFKHFCELGFSGGVLKTAAGTVAFSIGERINADTFCVHFEKARYDVNGAYTIINRDFAVRFCKDFKYINREDDIGDEGLRKAKLSYYPEMLLEKHVVVFK